MNINEELVGLVMRNFMWFDLFDMANRIAILKFGATLGPIRPVSSWLAYCSVEEPSCTNENGVSFKFLRAVQTDSSRIQWK
jgi:hypothetical protein